MEYRHIDTKILRGTTKNKGDENEEEEVLDDMAVAVDDDVFLDVLKESECNVGFLLTKSTS
jgi:DNA repair and recombination protein RAD54B